MKVRPFSSSMAFQWDAFVKASSNGSLFHTSVWKAVLEAAFGYTSYYFYVEREGTICGVLPLFLVSKPWGGRVLVSVPFGVYGGICSTDPEACQALQVEAQRVADQLHVSFLELRQADFVGLGWPTTDLYSTFVRPIFPDEATNLQAIPRKQRRMVRQGAKHGLVLSVGTWDLLPDFYHVYSTSLRNLGTPAFPYRFFEVLLEQLPDQVKIFSMWKADKMLGAVLTFLYRDRLMPYYGGGLPAGLPYAVYDAMYWEVMRYGMEHGFTVFDFGRSKRGTGAYDFKRHWGFEPTVLPYQFYCPQGGSIPQLNPSNPKFAPLIALWKRLPLWAANRLGPKVLPYFP